MKILIVDDDPSIRDFLEIALSMEGFEVITAFDGVDALEKIIPDVDLVISDMNMPRMNGVELLRKIKADTALSAIELIGYSGLYEDGEKFLEVGAINHFKKGNSLLRLIEKVKSLAR